jgi:hypothetical protein
MYMTRGNDPLELRYLLPLPWHMASSKDPESKSWPVGSEHRRSIQGYFPKGKDTLTPSYPRFF